MIADGPRDSFGVRRAGQKPGCGPEGPTPRNSMSAFMLKQRRLVTPACLQWNIEVFEG